MKDNEFKYWIFYLVNSRCIFDISNYDIYAFTDNKEIAENFIKTRNMNKFYLKKMKLNREERNNLIKNNLNSELSFMEGTTRTRKYKVTSFKIAVTKHEKLFCNNDETIYIHEYLYRFVWGEPSILKDKYINALSTLGFIQMHEMIVDGDMDSWSDTVSRMHPDHFNMILSHVKDLFIENTIEEEG